MNSISDSIAQLSTSQRRRLKLIAFLAFLVAIVPIALFWRLEAVCSRYPLETDESQYYLPSEEFLVPLSLGYREATAGVIWVRLLVYFGQQHEVAGDFRYLEPYLVGITRLDPYFYRAYTWGSMAAIYNGTLIHVEDVWMSIRMLERGIEVFPDDGDLHYYLGFQYYSELAHIVPRSERQRIRRIGVDELCTGALLGGGPPYLPLLCSSVASRQGFDQVAQDRLVQTLLDAQNSNTRTRIEARLENNLTPDVAFRIMQQINTFRTRWTEEFPYVPSGLYMLIGPRPTVPLRDQIDLPLPMDAMIAAAEEEMLYSDEEAVEEVDTEEAVEEEAAEEEAVEEEAVEEEAVEEEAVEEEAVEEAAVEEEAVEAAESE